MADNKVYISTDALAGVAVELENVALLFHNAHLTFTNNLSITAFPRPWADDATGQQFDSYYEPVEAGTKTALKDVAEGLSNFADMFLKLSMSYQAVEDLNSH